MSNSPLSNRQQLAKAKRWVIKIGSALLTNDGRGLNLNGMQSWVDQIAALIESGHEVVLVDRKSTRLNSSYITITSTTS